VVPSRKNQRQFGELKTESKIRCSSGVHPYKRLLDQRIMRFMPARRGVAWRWLTAVIIAVMWTSELRGSLQAQQLQGAPVGTRHAPAHNVNFRTSGDYGLRMVQERSQLLRLSQATGGQLQKGITREHYGPELGAPAQGAAIELQKSLLQERERAERLDQALAPAKRELETPTPLGSKVNEVSTRQKQGLESGAVELQNALQQLRERAERLEQSLAPAKRQPETPTTITAKESDGSTNLKQSAERGIELQKSLQQERERAAQLQQALQAAQREIETQTALAAKANEEATRLKQAAESGAELQKSLQEERERAAQLEQDVATAKRELETQTALAAKANEQATRLKHAAESATVELKSVQQERGQTTQLEQALAAAKRELETQTALAAKANEEATRLKQAADTGAELQSSLQQERERSAQREQDLAAAKRELETQTALAGKADEEARRLKQAAESATVELKSVQQERERAAQLQQDLTAAKRELKRQNALLRDLSMARTWSYAYQEDQSRKPSEATAEPKPPAESGAALRKSLQWERSPAKQLERALMLVEHVKDSSRSTGTVAVSQMARNELLEVQPRPASSQVSVPNARADLQPDPADVVEVAKLRARASVLLGQGDIGAARVVLERAADKGSAQAAFELAETYDPLVLPRWRTYGTRGDASKARDLYSKAETGGIKEAKQRSDALRR
jgi:hypothetical protein